MKTKIFAAAMAICLMAGTSAFAQRSERTETNKERERPTNEQVAARMTARVAEKLDLDEKQKSELYRFNLQQIIEMQDHQERMRTAHQANDAKMKELLTADQYEQWQKMQRQHTGKRDGKRGRGDQMHKGKYDAEGCCCDKSDNKSGKKARKEKK